LAKRHYNRGFNDDAELYTCDMSDGVQQQHLADSLNRSYDVRTLGMHEKGIAERQVIFSV
jgi:hypothetical protein